MADKRLGAMNWERGKPHGVKGREPILWSKVRKREKVGKSPVDRDYIISHGEEILWVAQE